MLISYPLSPGPFSAPAQIPAIYIDMYQNSTKAGVYCGNVTQIIISLIKTTTPLKYEFTEESYYLNSCISQTKQFIILSQKHFTYSFYPLP